ncbi:hypothetical protein JAAARDRAFT_205903 [Jaapia argillacea MUCL 33604]|uniref:DUF6533 domain-containing protein n=1 Tax=Jaapia argillacea MUCL 33604 TaxID=933084 RepID=A0A067PY97_9AGAM|nr:hypothetical protein JAAARDRAFT_205903 [Jaapia argillacea MUCL 33604]
MSEDSSVQLLGNIELSRLCRVSATVIALYDHGEIDHPESSSMVDEIRLSKGICLNQETNLIWKQQRSVATALYIMTRYVGNLLVIANLFLVMLDLHTDKVSVRLMMFQGSAAIAPVYVVQVILQFRLYAIYDRSRWIAILMFSLFVIQIIFAMVFSLYDITSLRAISQNFDIFDVCVVTHIPRFSCATWICVMAFEAVLFLLALWKVILRVMKTRERWRKGLVADILLRDNLLYFLVASTTYILTAISILALPTIWLEIFGSYSTVISCTLGSRLILNIRGASYRHQEIDTEHVDYELQNLGSLRDVWLLSGLEMPGHEGEV